MQNIGHPLVAIFSWQKTRLKGTTIDAIIASDRHKKQQIISLTWML
jgi:hypothetical protein